MAGLDAKGYPVLDGIADIEMLEEMISRPSDGVVETMKRLSGDVLVLGVSGKMGPSLARMALRASDTAGVRRRIIGVARFSSGEAVAKLESDGIETIRCDLLDPEQVEALPDVENVVFMAGMKFGTTGQESQTWAINSFLPGQVCRKYKDSRIVAFSTGNVYGLSPVCYGGSIETDAVNPEGEYAMSALGRERIFEHFSRTSGTRCSLIRLNYAVELRYGVLVDIAQRVFSGQAVDLSMGTANVIWQADANAMALQAFDFASTPPFVLNVAGPEMISIRRVAEQFADMFGKDASFTGSEGADSLLSNGQKGHTLFGYPTVGLQQMMVWIADWIMKGGASHGKPTHFEDRAGRF